MDAHGQGRPQAGELPSWSDAARRCMHAAWASSATRCMTVLHFLSTNCILEPTGSSPCLSLWLLSHSTVLQPSATALSGKGNRPAVPQPPASPLPVPCWPLTSTHLSVTEQCLARSGRTILQLTHSWFQWPAQRAGESRDLQPKAVPQELNQRCFPARPKRATRKPPRQRLQTAALPK